MLSRPPCNKATIGGTFERLVSAAVSDFVFKRVLGAIEGVDKLKSFCSLGCYSALIEAKGDSRFREFDDELLELPFYTRIFDKLILFYILKLVTLYFFPSLFCCSLPVEVCSF